MYEWRARANAAPQKLSRRLQGPAGVREPLRGREQCRADPPSRCATRPVRDRSRDRAQFLPEARARKLSGGVEPSGATAALEYRGRGGGRCDHRAARLLPRREPPLPHTTRETREPGRLDGTSEPAPHARSWRWRRSIIAKATGRPLTLALIDMDHFKDINDRCGHAAGDLCCRNLRAPAARRCARPTSSDAGAARSFCC